MRLYANCRRNSQSLPKSLQDVFHIIPSGASFPPSFFVSASFCLPFFFSLENQQFQAAVCRYILYLYILFSMFRALVMARYGSGSAVTE